MKIYKLHKGCSQLQLFFIGWSASPHLFDYIQKEPDMDVWIVYDYRSLSFDADLSAYRRVYVTAWSMGVWAASHLMQTGQLVPDRATAINGTPYAADDTFGIPEAIFRATLYGLTEESIHRFNRRMCGSREVLQAYEQAAPPRPLEEVREELQCICNTLRPFPSGAGWKHAVIGTADRIFPASNQRNYWQGRCPITEIEAPHYPFPINRQTDEPWIL